MNNNIPKDKEYRYGRQQDFFGAEGQEKISSSRVAIVGLGGIGSHVIQQLVYLGVKDFVLIDHDIIEITNLNRLIGATEADVGKKKVDIAAQLIQSIQPSAKIEVHTEPVHSQVLRNLKDRNVLIGCVDNDGARLVLLEISCQYSIPYIDVATEIDEDKTLGGHVVFTGIGNGCLMCRNLIDQNEVQINLESKVQEKEREKIYGINTSALNKSGPSVVMLNGLLASAAVIEFVAHITDFRNPNSHLIYRGGLSTFTKDNDHKTTDCYYCEHVYANKASIDLDKYC